MNTVVFDHLAIAEAESVGESVGSGPISPA